MKWLSWPHVAPGTEFAHLWTKMTWMTDRWITKVTWTDFHRCGGTLYVAIITTAKYSLSKSYAIIQTNSSYIDLNCVDF